MSPQRIHWLKRQTIFGTYFYENLEKVQLVMDDRRA